MRFAFDEDALLLQSTVRDFLKKECTAETVRAIWAAPSGRRSGAGGGARGERGPLAALWAKLAELGVVGALAPEANGGMGLDEATLVLLLEETGRAALPAPLVATAAVAVPLLREVGGAVAATWLPRVAAGDAVVAVGHPVNPFVADADRADLLLLPDGDSLHAVAPDAVSLVRQPANDPGRRLFTVAWQPAAGTRIAAGPAALRLLDAALDRGALASAAQALGVSDRLLEIAVGHAQQREQFGRPIGSFQGLQHRLADVAVRIAYARPVVYKAAHGVARAADAPEAFGARCGVDVSHAKLAAVEAASLAARAALQVHGAIGYTWEQDLHLWMRRAWSLERDWGDGVLHRERVARFVLAEGAPIGPGRTFPPAG